MAHNERNHILIVDDLKSNRMMLCNALSDMYTPLEAANGREAMELIRAQHDTIVAVVTDIVMPEMDGLALLETMGRERFLQEFPVICVTLEGQKSVTRALQLGALDVLPRPVDVYTLRHKLSTLVELFGQRDRLEERVEEQEKTINARSMGIINAMATLCEFRSFESGQHNLRIQHFSEILLREMLATHPEYPLDERAIDAICCAAVLHDVGKIMIPDGILNKPGKLTEEEYVMMKDHTLLGHYVIKKLEGVVDEEVLGYADNIALYHHERWDGKGYPVGLKGENIPLCAQAVSLADVYDALTSQRSYKPPFSHQQAVEMILAGECGAFSPELLGSFCRVGHLMEEFARQHTGAITEDETAPHVLTPPVHERMGSVQHEAELAMERYRALLQMLEGAVLEVDVNTDTCKVAYRSDMLESLRNGSRISDIPLAILPMVYPEDRAIASRFMHRLEGGFFEEGLRTQRCTYRMRESDWSDYCWVEQLFLRLNTRDPNERKALCLWRKLRFGPTTVPKGDAATAKREQESTFLNRFSWLVLSCCFDKDNTIEQGGEGLARLLGYTADEFRRQFGNRYTDLIVPEDRALVQEKLLAAYERSTVMEEEYRLRHKSGAVVWVKDRCRLERAEQEMRLHRILEDKTRERGELESLRQELENCQKLLRQSGEQIRRETL